MEKQNAEMMEYLKSLENIVQFQSYVLEHIHDDFSVLFKVLSKCFGMDALLTYSCTESGLVDSVVYRKDSDDVTKYQTIGQYCIQTGYTMPDEAQVRKFGNTRTVFDKIAIDFKSEYR